MVLKVVQHATASALNNQEVTTTFLLLPYWIESSTLLACLGQRWDSKLPTMHEAEKYETEGEKREQERGRLEEGGQRRRGNMEVEN